MITEHPPDPSTAITPAELVERLAELRVWSGSPSLRRLRQLAGHVVSPSGDVVDALPPSTSSYVLNGRGLPKLPRMEFVESYVSACLAACGRPQAEVAEEVDRWRLAWRALASTALTAAVESEVSEAPVTTAATGAEELAAPILPAPRARSRPVGRGVVMLAVTATGLVLGGLLAFGRDSTAASPLPGGQPAEERHGTVTALTDTQGIDFDTGQVKAQHQLGVDVTPWGHGMHLVTKSDADIALLPAEATAGYGGCARLPAADWREQVKGLAALPTGRGACVLTTQGRIALLVFDDTSARGSVGFHYVVWKLPAGWRPPGGPAQG
jgi:hypothetical protein